VVAVSSHHTSVIAVVTSATCVDELVRPMRLSGISKSQVYKLSKDIDERRIPGGTADKLRAGSQLSYSASHRPVLSI
jgi:hypothetical protein